MTDDADDTLDDRLDAIQRRAKNFRELLKDGEEITLAFQDGDLFVQESYRSKFERTHAKLFGRMLAIDEQMKTGTFPYFLGLLAFIVFLVGLQLSWWEGVLGEAACNLLNGWWFYLLAPVGILYLVHVIAGRWGIVVYRRHRQELIELIAKEGLDRDVLLVMLREEGDLDNVVYCLKVDHGPFI